MITKTYTRDTHFIIYNNGLTYLASRIDRSYKGKDDDIGVEITLLSDEELEQCKKEGFTSVLLPKE